MLLTVSLPAACTPGELSPGPTPTIPLHLSVSLLVSSVSLCICGGQRRSSLLFVYSVSGTCYMYNG